MRGIIFSFSLSLSLPLEVEKSRFGTERSRPAGLTNGRAADLLISTMAERPHVINARLRPRKLYRCPVVDVVAANGQSGAQSNLTNLFKRARLTALGELLFLSSINSGNLNFELDVVI